MKFSQVWAVNSRLAVDYCLVFAFTVFTVVLTVAVVIVSAPVGLKAACVVPIIVFSSFFVRTHLLKRSAVSIVFLRWREGGFDLETQCGDLSRGYVLGSTIIWPWIIFLNMTVDDSNQQVFITPNTVGDDAYRRLVVTLRTVGLKETFG